MLRNFRAFDVLHDDEIQKDVEKLLVRAGFDVDKDKHNQHKRNGRKGAILRGLQTKTFRSPHADIEICRSVLSFLKSHLIYHEEITAGHPHAVSLEIILQQRRHAPKRRAIALKQQMELALLWYVLCAM